MSYELHEALADGYADEYGFPVDAVCTADGCAYEGEVESVDGVLPPCPDCDRETLKRRRP